VALAEILAAQGQRGGQPFAVHQPLPLRVHVLHLEVQQQPLYWRAVALGDRRVRGVEQGELKGQRPGPAQAYVPVGLEGGFEAEQPGVEVVRFAQLGRADDRVEAGQGHDPHLSHTDGR
jgi:hypothetical protein